jgi:hypothetical protein
MSVKIRFRPGVEALEGRTTPSITSPISEGGVTASVTGGSVATLKGVLAVTPPAAQAPAQTIDIHQQVSHITLPDGDVVPGHGLKTAEAQNPVVSWIPTGPAQSP